MLGSGEMTARREGIARHIRFQPEHVFLDHVRERVVEIVEDLPRVHLGSQCIYPFIADAPRRLGILPERHIFLVKRVAS